MAPGGDDQAHSVFPEPLKSIQNPVRYGQLVTQDRTVEIEDAKVKGHTVTRTVQICQTETSLN
jgi:hypothetical protein